eukprot:m.369444 g.369444  ORF g.369444 m.369444 type:complete len:221 (-) comp56116_c0_seq8:4-666(-)
MVLQFYVAHELLVHSLETGTWTPPDLGPTANQRLETLWKSTFGRHDRAGLPQEMQEDYVKYSGGFREWTTGNWDKGTQNIHRTASKFIKLLRPPLPPLPPRPKPLEESFNDYQASLAPDEASTLEKILKFFDMLAPQFQSSTLARVLSCSDGSATTSLDSLDEASLENGPPVDDLDTLLFLVSSPSSGMHSCLLPIEPQMAKRLLLFIDIVGICRSLWLA